MKLPRNFPLSSGIDPVPFINVFFLIFMFYIFYPEALKSRVFDINSYSQSAKTGILYDTEAVVTLKQNGMVMINRIPVRWDNLGIKIKEIYNMDSNITVIIKGDKSVPFGKIMDTMNVLRLTGIKKMRLAAEIMK